MDIRFEADEQERKEAHSGSGRANDGVVCCETGVEKENGVEPVDVESLVSMNFWGFFPPFLDELEAAFPAFLRSAGDYMKAEYLLPTSVDAMIKANTAAVKVLKSEDHWFGVTYHEDKQSVKDAFADLIARGVYDSPLDLVQR